MKNAILLMIILTCFVSASEVSLDAYGFGLSYHTNRNIEWNEKNYGFGLGVSYSEHKNDDSSFIFLTGMYKDSYFNTASFALVGINHLIYGTKNGFHIGIMGAGGYYNGSDFDKFGVVVAGSIGYNRIDLCITGMPNLSGNETYAPTPEEANSNAIAAFIKIRVIDF